jgi:hypothetical protein
LNKSQVEEVGCHCDSVPSLAEEDGDKGTGVLLLAKTGARMIEQIDPAATEMYLAHVENGMKRA